MKTRTATEYEIPRIGKVVYKGRKRCAKIDANFSKTFPEGLDISWKEGSEMQRELRSSRLTRSLTTEFSCWRESSSWVVSFAFFEATCKASI